MDYAITFARRAIETHNECYKDDVQERDTRTKISNLLIDLAHLAKSEGLDFSTLCLSAEINCEEESE